MVSADSITQEQTVDAPSENYGGIGWYFKVLRHYADFSGRARPKEYWMFVLFNIIFNCMWLLPFALLLVLTNRVSSVQSLAIPLQIANWSYAVAIVLPTLAVTVRRLHDLGKSGWMLLIWLILALVVWVVWFVSPMVGGNVPIVVGVIGLIVLMGGGIWWIVLMARSGQPHENQYGPDPMKSSKVFDEPAKLKSAGITLIVAATAAVMPMIIMTVGSIGVGGVAFIFGGAAGVAFIFNIFIIVSYLILLVAGILLLGEKQIHEMRNGGITVIVLLLVAFYILLVVNISNLIFNLSRTTQGLGWEQLTSISIILVFNLLLVLFAASFLVFRQNTNLVRCMAISAIVFAVLSLLWNVYYRMGLIGNIGHYFQRAWFEGMGAWYNIIVGRVPLLLSYIVLAGTFLSGTWQAVSAGGTPVLFGEKRQERGNTASGYDPSNRKPKLRSLGKETKGQYTYEYYAASSAEEAKLFLSFCEVTQPLYYIQIETPEGVWGLDKDGLYLVGLLPFQKDLSLAQCEGKYTSIPSFTAMGLVAKGVADNFVSSVVCGSCGHTWQDGLCLGNKTIVRCPKCQKYNSVDTSNIHVL